MTPIFTEVENIGVYHKNTKERTGQKFGRLTVVNRHGSKKVKNGSLATWLCKCSCGNECIVASRDLRDGSTKSCGCLFREARENLKGSAGWNALPEGESALRQLFGNYRRSAKQRGYAFNIDIDEFRLLTNSACFYCGTEPKILFHPNKHSNGTFPYNGIDRVDNSLGYDQGNIRPCCKQCNIAKNVLSEKDFSEWIAKIFRRIVGNGIL